MAISRVLEPGHDALRHEELTSAILGAAIEVHSGLGPKSIDGLLPIHEAQLLDYLRLRRFPAGIMINFNVLKLRDGIMRRVMCPQT